MEIHYYLSLFPTEALIASQLLSQDFGSYMAIGSRKGQKENIVFVEIMNEFSDLFDWETARKRCIPHRDGRPKHSVYLSVYRVLERIPMEVLGSLYLVTKDGKSLELRAASGQIKDIQQPYYVYQELCPATPQIVSLLKPSGFAQYLTSANHMIHIPKIFFADLKILDFSGPEHRENLGGIYERKIEHLKDCVHSVTSSTSKVNKTLSRTGGASFTYQAGQQGFYFSDGEQVTMYPMKTKDELREENYYWAKSALIL